MTPHATDHQAVHELLGSYALDTLNDLEARRVERHVTRCDDCHAELRSLLGAVDALAVAPDQHELPVAIRTSVLDAIDAIDAIEAGSATTARFGAVSDRPTWAARASRRFVVGRPAFAAVAAACLLVVGVGVGSQLNWSGDGPSRPSDAGIRTPADTMTGTSGVVDVDTSGALADTTMELVDVHGAGMLVTKNLPEPPAGYAWRVWGVSGGHDMHAIGPLDPDAEGTMALQPVIGVHGHDYDAVAITLERADAGGDSQQGPVVGWARMA
ncbi:MAG: anti-sigma factor [Thermoleophilia bacterium]|nr:anti-sigma factor [Thermoleophilia bacterium]